MVDHQTHHHEKEALLFIMSSAIPAMHRVGSSGNTSSSVRTRKEKRLTYVLNDADDTKVILTLVQI